MRLTDRARGWLTRGAIILMAAIGGITMAVSSKGCASGAAEIRDAREARIEQSVAWNGKKFEAPLPEEEIEFWSTLGDWIRGADNTTPEEPIPILELSAADFASPPDGGLRVTWLGHSTSLVEIDGHRVLVDPVWSDRVSPVKFAGPKRFHPVPIEIVELPELDAVVISHDHYDHLDRKTVMALGASGAQFVVPLGVGAHLVSWGIPHERVVELDWWEEHRIGELTLVATPGRHFSGRSVVMADRNETLWAGWALIGPEHRVYYSGDTAMFPGFAEIGERLGPFDITMFEIGAYNAAWRDVHIGPEQAVEAHRLVRGEVLLPVHWGTFDLALHAWTEPAERVLVAAESAGVDLALPRPGESVIPSEPRELARWWPDVPWQTAEEAPLVSSALPAAAPTPTEAIPELSQR